MKKAGILLAVAVVGCGCESQNAGGDPGGAPPDGKYDSVSACEVDSALLDAQGRKFMIETGLLDDESRAPGSAELPFELRWCLAKKTVHEGRCLAVFTDCVFSREDGTLLNRERTAFQVISYADEQGSLSFHRFEEVFDIPQTLRAAIGLADRTAVTGIEPEENDGGWIGDRWPTDLYYAEFPRESAVEILKSVFTRVLACGFMANLVEGGGGPLDFDPTPNRIWHVENATYSMNRGATAEIGDIRPSQLDGDFRAYYEGSGGFIAPWGACYVRKLGQADTFTDVTWDPLPPPGNGEIH